MLLKEIYNKLEKMGGGFSTTLEDLTTEQIDFLEKENEYNINLEDLLDVIDNYSYSEEAEICGTFNDVEDLAYQELSDLFNIPENIMNYIDLERFGKDLLEEECYYELSDGRILYIGL